MREALNIPPQKRRDVPLRVLHGYLPQIVLDELLVEPVEYDYWTECLERQRVERDAHDVRCSRHPSEPEWAHLSHRDGGVFICRMCAGVHLLSKD